MPKTGIDIKSIRIALIEQEIIVPLQSKIRHRNVFILRLRHEMHELKTQLSAKERACIKLESWVGCVTDFDKSMAHNYD